MPDSVDNVLSENTARVKIINEFLVDIVGVLVPGAIFLFSVIVGFIIPIFMIYFDFRGAPGNLPVDAATKMELMISNVFQGWFWLVIFFTFLILAYAIGNIFYRSDINDVDKECFRREKKDHYDKQIKKKLDKSSPSGFLRIEEGEVDDFYHNYIRALLDHLKTNDARWNPNNKKENEEKWERLLLEGQKGQIERKANLLTRKKAINYINYVAYKLYYHQNRNEKIPSIDDVTTMFDADYADRGNWASILQKQQAIISTLLKDFAKINVCPRETPANTGNPLVSGGETPTNTGNPPVLGGETPTNCTGAAHCENTDSEDTLAVGWFFLFYLRSEIACGYEDECQFPYQYYDAYLAKRDVAGLGRHVKWCKTKDARTKNAINQFKIEVRLRAGEYYNIIVKNEAHIRMASSSYQVAWLFRYISCAFMFVLAALVCKLFFGECNEDNFARFWCIGNLIELAFKLMCVLWLPVGILLLNVFIRKRVLDFLHYQRLREIFFVLKVFDEMEKQVSPHRYELEKKVSPWR